MRAESWKSWRSWNKTIEQTLDDVQKEVAGDEPIASLRKKAGAVGTRSVLDVDELAHEAKPGTCWVLSAKDLHEHFGSKHPTKKVIEGGIDSFLGTRRHPVAVTAYTHGMPSAVLFAGWPFD